MLSLLHLEAIHTAPPPEILARYCNFITPFEVAAQQHVESFHPDKVAKKQPKPSVDKVANEQPTPSFDKVAKVQPASSVGGSQTLSSDSEIREEFGIGKSIKVKLVQVTDIIKTNLPKRSPKKVLAEKAGINILPSILIITPSDPGN